MVFHKSASALFVFHNTSNEMQPPPVPTPTSTHHARPLTVGPLHRLSHPPHTREKTLPSSPLFPWLNVRQTLALLPPPLPNLLPSTLHSHRAPISPKPIRNAGSSLKPIKTSTDFPSQPKRLVDQNVRSIRQPVKKNAPRLSPPQRPS